MNRDNQATEAENESMSEEAFENARRRGCARYQAGKIEDASPPELTTTYEPAIEIKAPKAWDMGETWMRVFLDEPTDGSPSRGFYVGCQSGAVDVCYFATAEEAERHLLDVYLASKP